MFAHPGLSGIVFQSSLTGEDGVANSFLAFPFLLDI